MFGQLMFMRLKAAEKALQGGRLDEAYRIATSPDLRGHKRAAAILSGLAEKLMERAREHFRADRFSEALMDLDRAEAGGLHLEQVAELRGHVHAVAAEEQRKDQARRQRVQDAAMRIESGSLAAGRRILEHASADDLPAQQLRGMVKQRSDEATELLGQIEHLIGQGQWPAAVARLRKAKALDAHHPEVTGMEATLCDRVIQHSREALAGGKLSRAADELACLGDLARESPVRKELAQALHTATEAARCLQANLFGEARRQLMSLERRVPEAAWVRETVELLRRLDDLRIAVAAGPLGEKPGTPVNRPVPRQELSGPIRLEDTVAVGLRPTAMGGLPDRLLLLVDGGGSYLLIRGSRASLGRAASDHLADIPMYCDLAERHAEITRIDDDYFLVSARDVEVAGKTTRHELLQDGDRVVLGRKGKFAFRVPSRQSLTAALDLSDTTKMPNDVRRVLLFHQHATIGNGPAAHIRVIRAGGNFVLYERGGSLWVRSKSDGHGDRDAKPLALGEPMEIGGIRMTLEPWKVRNAEL